MSNPNNLVRPAVLNENNTAPSGAPRLINISELGPIITEIASQIFQRQVPGLVQAAINPNAENQQIRDQVIDEQFLNNLGDLDKVPDVVNCLREFFGKPGEFSSWKKSVDRILRIYDNQKGTPRYYGILNVIRNKIVGNADTTLESYNTPLDWTAISRCLALLYADKRDLSTLEYQLTSLVQNDSSIQQFYQAVYSHLSLILNKLNCLEASPESISLLIETYRGKALDTFIRGLNGDLPKLLGMKEPADLPQALHLCLKLENQSYRANYAQNTNRYTHPNIQRFNNQLQRDSYHQPPIPPKPFKTMHNHPFYPQIAYIPQSKLPYYPQQQPYMNNINSHNPNARPNNNNYQIPNSQFPRQNPMNPPQRPSAPKPQPKPEPMDIDSSIHSKRINYMNRPHQQNYPTKRAPPPPSTNIQQHKIQRNFHINLEADNAEPILEEQDSSYDQTLDDYIANIDETITISNSERQSEIEQDSIDPIHFLN